MSRHILTVNSGSSSLKFALYRMQQDETRLLAGSLEGIGNGEGRFEVRGGDGRALVDRQSPLPDHRTALQTLFTWLQAEQPAVRLEAVGHRIVYGGPDFIQPHRVTPELVARLGQLVSFAPDHLPHEIKAIQVVSQDYPGVQQVACFDTAFHRALPRLARIYALPRSLEQAGVRRYGFHGASLTAVSAGRSLDTTMGLTPLGGLVMGTRSGDLDPGVLLYLLRQPGQSVETLDHLLNQQSGLLGVSGLSADMQELLENEEQDPHAAEAVALFCYQAKKFLGALAAALGGLDTLVFAGGIGENAPAIRWRICQGLEFLGIHLDAARNQANASRISPQGSPVTVRVMKTDEELMIARHTCSLLNE
jgi:acetate kinase